MSKEKNELTVAKKTNDNYPVIEYNGQAITPKNADDIFNQIVSENNEHTKLDILVHGKLWMFYRYCQVDNNAIYTSNGGRGSV